MRFKTNDIEDHGDNINNKNKYLDNDCIANFSDGNVCNDDLAEY